MSTLWWMTIQRAKVLRNWWLLNVHGRGSPHVRANLLVHSENVLLLLDPDVQQPLAMAHRPLAPASAGWMEHSSTITCTARRTGLPGRSRPATQRVSKPSTSAAVLNTHERTNSRGWPPSLATVSRQSDCMAPISLARIPV